MGRFHQCCCPLYFLFGEEIEERRNVSAIAEYIRKHIISPRTIAQLCRILYDFYERNGDRDFANMVFAAGRRVLRWRRVEMASKDLDECRERGSPSCWREWFRLVGARLSSFIEWGLADLTCEYGINRKRPLLIWFVVVLGLFPIPYILSNDVGNADSPIDYLYFSVITATTVGFGDIYPIGIGRVLAGVEAVFGMFIWTWTVFLLAFTRKYMS